MMMKKGKNKPHEHEFDCYRLIVGNVVISNEILFCRMQREDEASSKWNMLIYHIH